MGRFVVVGLSAGHHLPPWARDHSLVVGLRAGHHLPTWALDHCLAVGQTAGHLHPTWAHDRLSVAKELFVFFSESPLVLGERLSGIEFCVQLGKVNSDFLNIFVTFGHFGEDLGWIWEGW